MKTTALCPSMLLSMLLAGAYRGSKTNYGLRAGASQNVLRSSRSGDPWFCSTARLWQFLGLERLDRRAFPNAEVIAVEMQGHGVQPTSNAIYLTKTFRDVAGLLDYLKIQARYHRLQFGGGVAMQCRSAIRKKCEKVVSISAPFRRTVGQGANDFWPTFTWKYSKALPWKLI